MPSWIDTKFNVWSPEEMSAYQSFIESLVESKTPYIVDVLKSDVGILLMSIRHVAGVTK